MQSTGKNSSVLKILRSRVKLRASRAELIFFSPFVFLSPSVCVVCVYALCVRDG